MSPGFEPYGWEFRDVWMPDGIEELVDDAFRSVPIDSIPRNKAYWIPNITDWGQKIKVDVGKYEEMEPVEIQPEQIESDMKTFREYFVEELKVFEEEYRGKIKLIWGSTSFCW